MTTPTERNTMTIVERMVSHWATLPNPPEKERT